MWLLVRPFKASARRSSSSTYLAMQPNTHKSQNCFDATRTSNFWSGLQDMCYGTCASALAVKRERCEWKESGGVRSPEHGQRDAEAAEGG
jgi:hypothetical protein